MKFNEREEKRLERQRIKAIIDSAPPELREQAIQLALGTSLSVQECAQRLLAKVPETGLFPRPAQQERGSVWARALKEAALRHESQRR